MHESTSSASIDTGQVLTHRTNPKAPLATRVADWQSLLSDMVLPVRAEVELTADNQPGQTEFTGGLRMGRFGPAAWLEIDASAQILHRGSAEIMASEGRWLFASTMTRGYGWLHASGERQLVECGQTVFVDSAQTFSLEFNADFAFVSAMLPRAELLVYQPHAPGAHATRVPEPVGSALHSFLESLGGHEVSEESVRLAGARRLYDHFVGLVLSAIEPLAISAPQNRLTPSELLLSRIRGALLASLSYPELNTAWVAQRFNLSMRQVQRLFKADGTTVSKWVMEQRLCRCAEELAESPASVRSIGEIARSWGFADFSYFSRSFSNRYGVPPTLFRDQQGQSSPGVETRPGVSPALTTDTGK